MKKKLKKLGFKTVWFDDFSGCWYIKNIKYNGIKLQIYVEIDNDLLLLQVKNGDYMNHKVTMHKYYDAIKEYKLTLKNIKMLIKKYK